MENSKEIHILVVDDEEAILDLLQYNLEKEGYKVSLANNGLDAVKIAAELKPDLVLLDIMMPGQDGVETCRQIRLDQSLKNTFILFLTARSEEYSEISAFEMGADDYITKPIKPRALMSRIQALLRRINPKEENVLHIGDLVIDRNVFAVNKGEEEIFLPKKQFELLYYLASRPNKVLERDTLLNNIWGTDVYVLARTVDVHIRKIREKIGDEYISTIKGVGYKFVVRDLL